MPVDREERARLRAEKAARKAEQAEFRRTAKQLRSSDVAKRLDAIARVAEGRYLTDGDCLGPLLESLVVKKKTAAAVPRALKVLAAFFAPKGTCRPGALRIFEPADAVGTRCRGVDLISQHLGVVDGLPPHGGAAVAAVRCLRGLASAIHSAEDGEAAVLAPLFAEQGATAERILAFLAACATPSFDDAGASAAAPSELCAATVAALCAIRSSNASPASLPTRPALCAAPRSGAASDFGALVARARAAIRGPPTPTKPSLRLRAACRRARVNERGSVRCMMMPEEARLCPRSSARYQLRGCAALPAAERGSGGSAVGSGPQAVQRPASPKGISGVRTTGKECSEVEYLFFK